MTKSLEQLRADAIALKEEQTAIAARANRLQEQIKDAEAVEKARLEAEELKRKQAEATQAFNDLKALTPELNKASAHLAQLIRMFKEKAALTNSRSNSGVMRGEVNGAFGAVDLGDLPAALVSDDELRIFYAPVVSRVFEGNSGISRDRIDALRKQVIEGESPKT